MFVTRFLPVTVCFFILAAAGLPADANRPNAVSVDLAPPGIAAAAGGIGFGASYERAVFRYLSLRAGGGIIYIPFAEYDISGRYLTGTLLAGVRGYPAGRSPRGPYFGINGGYIGVSVRGREGDVPSSMGLHMPFVSAEAGWKFVFGRRRVGFFLEPYVHFLFIFEGTTFAEMGNLSSVAPSGSTIGLLILGFNLGLVF
ncbi:MAG: hypothetical protein ACLFRY_12640 [Spirochaetia bacterium]